MTQMGLSPPQACVRANARRGFSLEVRRFPQLELLDWRGQDALRFGHAPRLLGESARFALITIDVPVAQWLESAHRGLSR
jgi:hypothetical protein